MIYFLLPTDPDPAQVRWHWTLPRFMLVAALALTSPCDLGAQTIMNLPSATVKSFAGTVNVVSKSGNASEAYVGATLLPGEKLVVGANGTTELELPGAGAVRMEADSEVKLPEANGKTPPQESLEMLKGRLFLNINDKELKKKGKREFRLKTPTTVLAVKGTQFFAFASATGDTLGVHEGNVVAYETLSQQSRQLEAGTAVDASPGKLSAPRALRPAEQACAFIYPGAPVPAWVVPIENGNRCLTIGFIQTGNGDRYYLSGTVPGEYNKELWKESRGGERELVFRCLEGAQPFQLNQLLAGNDDTIFVMPQSLNRAGKGDLFQIVRGTARMVSPRSAWFTEVEKRDGYTTIVSFGRKPDGTIDPQGFYFGADKGIYQTTLTSRTTVSPPVLTYPGLTPAGFTMAGANDIYFATFKSDAIQHLKNSQDQKDLTIIARLPINPGRGIAITMGVWPLDEKPKHKP